MKLAVSGKGGVGKTLLSASLARAFADSGYSVIAIDADPDANLAATLGFPHPEQITPISEMKELIQERTGARPGQAAPYFTINPRVDDIPDKYAHRLDGIRLMRMGDVKGGGGGCYCPESALLKTLMAHLLVARNEVVILDMEAGIEHLGRGTAGEVDRLIVVVEPGRRSLETALSIKKLAADIGLKNLAAVGNKIRNDSDIEFLKSALPDFEFLGFIPYDQAVVDADLANRPVLTASPKVISAVKDIFQTLLSGVKATDRKEPK
jgi:CO dehydrogenase maturation factor